MIDKDKIPEPVYNELISLFGYEKAEEIIEHVHYNFKAIQNRILIEKVKRKFGKRIWIYFLIVGIIIAIIFVILKSQMII